MTLISLHWGVETFHSGTRNDTFSFQLLFNSFLKRINNTNAATFLLMSVISYDFNDQNYILEWF